jgi:DNA repair protein RadC
VSRRPAAACHERMDQLGVRVLSDAELLTILLSPTAGMNSTRDAAVRLLDALPLSQIAWAPPEELQQQPGIGPARAAAIAAAFELGRRGGWSPPKRGERVLDPRRVFELMRPLAHAEREEFHTVLLDVRGRLIKTVKIAEGSLTQCPVSPRDALREPVRSGAHGVVFVHNHPSGVMRSPRFGRSRFGNARQRALCAAPGLHNGRASAGRSVRVRGSRWAGEVLP